MIMEKNEPTQSKYDAALAKYNTRLDDAEIAAKVAQLIAEKSARKQHGRSQKIPVSLHRPHHAEHHRQR